MRIFGWLWVICATIFLGHYFVAGQAVYGDGIDYWAYLHSGYFDRDIDFDNEYRHNYNSVSNNSPVNSTSPQIQKTRTTRLGQVDNPHLPGVAILLAPFYFVADLLARVFNMFDFYVLRNGYADIYQVVCGLGAVTYTVLGCVLIYLLGKKVTGLDFESRLSAVAILATTPLLYYGAYDVINSHFASFLMTSIFWLCLISVRHWEKTTVCILAGIVGLAALIRIQELLLIVPAVILFFQQRNRVMKLLAWFLASLAVILVPILYVWNQLYGTVYPETYFLYGHVYRGFWGSWFHPLNGLFTRTPTLALVLIPLVKLVRRHQILMYMFGYFLIQSGLIILQGGWRDAAYGGRMYISSLPFFAVLMVGCLAWLRKHFPKWVVVGCVIFFAVVNCVQIANFILFEKEVNSGKKTGLEERTVEKIKKMWSF